MRDLIFTMSSHLTTYHLIIYHLINHLIISLLVDLENEFERWKIREIKRLNRDEEQKQILEKGER